MVSLLLLTAACAPAVQDRQGTVKPWPTCVRIPVRCDPTSDPFETTTTWRDATPDPCTNPDCGPDD